MQAAPSPTRAASEVDAASQVGAGATFDLEGFQIPMGLRIGVGDGFHVFQQRAGAEVVSTEGFVGAAESWVVLAGT